MSDECDCPCQSVDFSLIERNTRDVKEILEILTDLVADLIADSDIDPDTCVEDLDRITHLMQFIHA
ncbi:MAG: hypothetical protein Q4G46_10290 [Propionibacteriaceae bacterium]|nr:hypothetical protein [Propionibacteriaceae bacterium]